MIACYLESIHILQTGLTRYISKIPPSSITKLQVKLEKKT